MRAFFDKSTLLPLIRDTPFQALETLLSKQHLSTVRHGDLPKWQSLLAALPRITPSDIDLAREVRIGSRGDCTNEMRTKLRLIPWRKGPCRLFDIAIDSEWDSGMKWQRLIPHIQPLAGRKVLDVGCGNGYHCLRMTGAGASMVIGIEPYLIYVMQYLAIKHFLPDYHCYVLPASLEQLPDDLMCFDTVFSMGVIYHQRSPIDHLLLLKRSLRKGGELVLETLVVDGDPGYSLVPETRYARMSNVWFVPSCETLIRWLKRCNFSNIRIVDLCVTSTSEQRSTAWMPFESLADSLDSNDNSLTIEGLPAPKRAILICNSPG
jgi:tRNA (mo5U34)-methyltransferase